MKKTLSLLLLLLVYTAPVLSFDVAGDTAVVRIEPAVEEYEED